MNLGPYAKAISAGAAELATVLTALVTVLAFVPSSYQPAGYAITGITAILGVLKTFGVYQTPNVSLAATVGQAVEQAAPLVRDVEALAKHQATEVVVSTPLTPPATPPGFVPGPGAK